MAAESNRAGAEIRNLSLRIRPPIYRCRARSGRGEDPRPRLLRRPHRPSGLPNRALFLERLDGALKSALQHKRIVALLFIDLDRFKRVNDTLGHAVGDRLLSHVADRLQAAVRSCDTVARADIESDASISRLGGDEFTILLTEISTPVDAAYVAERILDGLSSPFVVDEHEIFALEADSFIEFA